MRTVYIYIYRHAQQFISSRNRSTIHSLRICTDDRH